MASKILYSKIKIITYPNMPDILPNPVLTNYNQQFLFRYTYLTKIKTLVKYVKKLCKAEIDYGAGKPHVMIQLDDDLYWLNQTVPLSRLIQAYGLDEIRLCLISGIGGTVGYDEKNGITFFVHSNERNHTPHVHAKYQGEDISIDLYDYSVIGHFKNKKKLKEAQKYVHEHRKQFIEDFYAYTNGICPK